MNALDARTWWIIGGLLGLGLVVALAWYLRQVSLRRAQVPGAFLIALFIHALLGGGLFYVGLGDELLQAVKKVQDILPPLENYATSTRFEAHEGYRDAPQPFELVKELAAKDSVTPAEVPQTPLETPEMRVTPGDFRSPLSVPREDSAGNRADETPLVPNTPRPVSPARTVVPEIETPMAPSAPLENVPSLPTVRPTEARVLGPAVELARAPALVELRSDARPERGKMPAIPGEPESAADLVEERAFVAPPRATSPDKVSLARTTRDALDDAAPTPEPVRPDSTSPNPGVNRPSAVNRAAVPVEMARAAPQLPAPELGPAAITPPGSGQKPIPNEALTGTPDRNGLRPSTTAGIDLPRRMPLDAGRAVAKTDIGPEMLLRDRTAKKDDSQIEARGGTRESQAAVARGLSWLERHQFADGHWSLHDFSRQCRDHERCTGEGNLPCDTAGTALSLLPFLGDGHTQFDGRFPAVVDRGLDWLVKKQRRSGELTTGNEGKARLYGHGLAAIALCEAYAMTHDPRLREPAQRSLDFIVAAQHKPSGGWRYQPNEPADTSVVGWQVMALKSGQMAQLNVPQQPFDLARKWLDSVEGRGLERGRFGYQSRDVTTSMTAEGLLCRQYLGADRDDPSLLSGADFLLTHLPTRQEENGYYWYYGTQTMYHLQGDYWKKWNAALRDLLVESQIKEGSLAGTWNPVDRGEVTGGRVFTTSLRVLMLEVYYRHLPLYQTLGEAEK